MSNTKPTLVIREARLEEILGLRHDLLIVGTNRTSDEFPGDRDPTTRHFAAFEGGEVLCCATFLRSEWERRPAWQLRGMATRTGRQGEGIGRRLLDVAEAVLAREGPIRQLWCNARIGAVGFYENVGWRVVSDAFMIEGVGVHKKMTKMLEEKRGDGGGCE